jgi:SH3 domain protein
MKFSTHIPLVLIALLIPLSQAIAETRYVSDQLVVTVRSHKGDAYNALESLITDSPVEILSEDKTYVKVRTNKGTEGFIRKQYITKKLPKAIQIKRLQAELTQLKQTLSKTQKSSEQSQKSASIQQSQVDELRNNLSQTSQKLEKISADYQRLLKDSENVLQVSNENEQLSEQNNQINSELAILRDENQSFHRSNMIQWFLAGAGVFLGGWAIGKISRKKQRGFSRI